MTLWLSVFGLSVLGACSSNHRIVGWSVAVGLLAALNVISASGLL